jgi:hypothetical protein
VATKRASSSGDRVTGAGVVDRVVAVAVRVAEGVADVVSRNAVSLGDSSPQPTRTTRVAAIPASSRDRRTFTA